MRTVRPPTPAISAATPLTAAYQSDTSRWAITWPGPAPALSTVLPHLEALGFTVESCDTYSAGGLGDGATTVYYSVRTRHPLAAGGPLLQDAFTASWTGLTDVDTFTELTGRAGLSWRNVLVLRVIARYLSLAGLPHRPGTISRTLLDHEQFTRALVDWFTLVHTPDPALAGGAAPDAEQAHQLVVARLEDALTLDADRVMRAMYETAAAVTRTNLAQRVNGAPAPWLTLKIDSPRLEFLPDPRPATETFVYSTTVEGLHLRADRVARGGLRWSDRTDDFRTEVLALMKAQQVKNALIVPSGAKGAFIVKSADLTPGNRADRGRAAYRDFVNGLLDITDNIVDGHPVPPADTVILDEADPYLVVAADKGTATFSDLANSIAGQRSFWLGDAFASGGSQGYDHKAMGITARGAWVSVREHLGSLGIDPDTDEFTAVGIGDMSGDVFGNGVQLASRIRLIAAFDHRHVFIDPTPTTDQAHAERGRLAALPGSSWVDYSTDLLSSGGGIWSRSAKRIDLSPQATAALGLQADVGPLSAPDLIRAVLAAPVDLLYNGGVGTYVKASTETHAAVGDPANDAVRVNATQLRSRAVAEGGNLGFTQQARVEASLAGVRINSDFIDNSAGVDTSDLEVNLKILLDPQIRSGQLTVDERDELLRTAEDDVAGSVLSHNARSVRAITAAADQAALLLDQHAQVMLNLEADTGLDRRIEQLPDATEIEARRRRGAGLTRPEIAVLLALSKNLIRDELVASDLPDDPRYTHVLTGYFPPVIRQAVGDQEIRAHRLARHITSTQLANALVDETGPGFLYRMEQRTGATTAQAVRAYFTARNLVDIDQLQADLDAVTLPHPEQLRIHRQVRTLLEQLATWLLRHPQLVSTTADIDRYRTAITHLAGKLPTILTGDRLARHSRSLTELTGLGTSAATAGRVAALPELAAALDIVAVADEAATPIDATARTLFDLEHQLSVIPLRDRITDLAGDDHWTLEAKAVLRAQVDTHLGRLAVTGARGHTTDAGDERRHRYDHLMRDLLDRSPVQLTQLTVVVDALGQLN